MAVVKNLKRNDEQRACLSDLCIAQQNMNNVFMLLFVIGL